MDAPPMDGGMPPMENPNMGGNMGMPPMGDPNMGGSPDMGTQPPQPQQPLDNGNDMMGGMPPTDEEGDAENTDPKKEIQSLAGKLSQKLNDYNTQLPQPDSGLNKYVSSMIAKQAVKGMSQEDVEYVINKLQTDEDTDNGMGDPIAEPPTGDEMIPPQEEQAPPAPPQPMQEAVRRRRMIDEIFQELTKPTDATNIHQEVNIDKGYGCRPWKSPFK